MARHETRHASDRLDDTGSFTSLESMPPLDDTTDDAPVIYGLHTNEDDARDKRERKGMLLLVGAGVCAAAILLAILLVARPFSRGTDAKADSAQTQSATTTKTTQPEAKEEPQGQDVKAEDEEEEVEEPVVETPRVLSEQPNSSELASQAAHLFFDGKSLSLPEDRVSVDVRAGRVQVTHVLDDPVTDTTLMAGNAALRCAALCNDIGGRSVLGAGEQQATPLSSVVWIVRDQNGDSYLAVYYMPGQTPETGEGLEVLAQSPRYRLSDSVYQSLGGAVQQEVGETPIMLNGQYIWSTATVAK